MEAAMNRGRLMTKTIPLLLGIGLAVSACAVEPDYGSPAYGAYPEPVYGSLDFDYGGWGGWGGGHHGWDHGHGDHGHVAHAGFGHGFAGHGGFGGHGGGGHGGGGHR
jgi:hypothetical protein